MSRMSHKWFLVAIVTAALLAFMCLLAVCGMAAMVQRTESATVFRGSGQPGQHFGLTPLFCGMGIFFPFVLLLLLLIGVGPFFHLRARKAAGGPKGERWAKHWAEHWHQHHGPTPPWCWGQEKPPEEKAEQAEADVEPGDAGPES